MTIYLWSGTPGSGKSLHMAQYIYWAVRMGRPVICNFEINGDAFKSTDSFRYVSNDELTPELLVEYSREYFKGKDYKEGAIRLYIDECVIKYDARRWNDPERKKWVEFFSQHRKLGYDVYLIAQYGEMIDKQIRALIEYEVKHRKVNNVGWFGGLVSLLTMGHPVVCAVTYWYPQKMRLTSEFILGRKKFYTLYDTYKIFG